VLIPRNSRPLLYGGADISQSSNTKLTTLISLYGSNSAQKTKKYSLNFEAGNTSAGALTPT
jgi:hypothetical protein